MAAFDSDFNRGYYQHKRAYSETVNDTGAPLPADLLEGEIAINIPLKKIYTKKQDFTTIDQYGGNPGRVKYFSQKGGRLYTNIRIDSSAIGKKVGIRFAQTDSENNDTVNAPPAVYVGDPNSRYNSEGFVRYTISDSDVVPSAFIAGLLGYVSPVSNGKMKIVTGTDLDEGDDDMFLVYDEDVAQQSRDLIFKVDSDFVRFVDHGVTNLSIMTFDSDIQVYGSTNLVRGARNRIKTFNDDSGITKITSNAIPVDYRQQADSDGVTNYLLLSKNFTGSVSVLDSDGAGVLTGDKLRLLKASGSSSIVDLTPGQTFVKSETAPNIGVGADLSGTDGDFWIQRPSTEHNPNSAGLYWLDLTVLDNTSAQTKARAYDDSERREKGIIEYDSDGAGVIRYAEWRKVRSGTDLVTDTATPISENITYTEASTLNIKGKLNIDSEIVLLSKITDLEVSGSITFDDKKFVRAQKFEIRDSADNIKFGIWGFDTDYDSDN